VAGRSAIGLDIGTSGVRAAELSFGKGQVTLEKFGQVALPEGAVRDGEVVYPDAVADAVKQLWAHTKFSSKKVVIGVANQKVIVRQVDLPWMPPADMKSTLPFQVQDFVPMPVDQAVLDFHPIEELTGDDGNRVVRGLLVAASREMINGSLDAVQKAGLSPVMVDLTPFAVIRALSDGDHLGMGAPVEALIDIGARVTNIVVHQGGVPRFVRILLMGGQDVTDAVAERMGVPQQQAEAMKQQLGLGLSAESMDIQAAARVVEAVGAEDRVRVVRVEPQVVGADRVREPCWSRICEIARSAASRMPVLRAVERRPTMLTPTPPVPSASASGSVKHGSWTAGGRGTRSPCASGSSSPSSGGPVIHSTAFRRVQRLAAQAVTVSASSQSRPMSR